MAGKILSNSMTITKSTYFLGTPPCMIDSRVGNVVYEVAAPSELIIARYGLLHFW